MKQEHKPVHRSVSQFLYTNPNRGFSLLELMTAITIVGILAASVFFPFRRWIKEVKGEEHILGFFHELRGMRAHARKENERLIFRLQVPMYSSWNGAYKVFVDYDKNFAGAGDWSNPDTLRTSFQMGSKVDNLEFGFPDPPFPESPTPYFKLADQSYPYAGGDWYLDIVDIDTGSGYDTIPFCVVFEPDELGTTNSGIFYLKHLYVPDIGYAIFKDPNGYEIVLYKWTGRKWYKM